MNSAQKSLVVVLAAAITVLLLLFLISPAPVQQPPDRAGAKTADPVTETVVENATDTMPTSAPAGAPRNMDLTTEPRSDKGKYFFDVVGHDEQQFQALLERAYMIYEQTPSGEREALEVVLVLHGPDVMFFDLRNQGKHDEILDLAEKLDAYGVFDFKMCTVSAQTRGIGADNLPAFIELVPYGPREISRLEEEGFMRM